MLKIDREKLKLLNKEQLLELLEIFLQEDENDSYSMYEEDSNYRYAIKLIDEMLEV